jgi:DNA repair exonuclease SbcCD nuclease subunit
MHAPTPLAVLVADLHLSLQQPACRADENWLAVQKRYLKQLSVIGLAVICAGDIFDRWNPSPELLVFAISPERI